MPRRGRASSTLVRRRRQTHMAGEGLQRRGGRQLVHVPYKGEGPAYSDLMAGVVEVAVANINAITPAQGDRLRALAVTGRERSALLPDVPTVAEAGVPGFEYTGWFALMAPAGTPQPIVDRLLADLKTAVEQPGMKRYFEEQGMSAAVRPPGPLKEEIVQESARWQAWSRKSRSRPTEPPRAVRWLARAPFPFTFMQADRDMSADLIALAAPVVFTAYVVFGMTGFGAAMVAVPILAQFLPLSFAVPLVVLFDLACTALVGGRNWRQVSRVELARLFPGCCWASSWA